MPFVQCRFGSVRLNVEPLSPLVSRLSNAFGKCCSDRRFKVNPSQFQRRTLYETDFCHRSQRRRTDRHIRVKQSRFSFHQDRLNRRFLSSGNTTFITGVDDDKVQSVVDLISAHSKRHSQYGADHRLSVARHGADAPERPRCRAGGATIFVLNVESFYQV